MRAKSEEFFINFTQIIQSTKWRVFVRTDDCKSVSNQRYEQYRVCPG